MFTGNGIGNVVKDAELKFVGSNKTPLCVCTIAFNRSFKPKDATEWQSETAFIETNLWGSRAETLVNFLKKGQTVFVRGHFLTQQWENDDGAKHSKLLLRLDTMDLVNRVKTNGNGGATSAPTNPPASNKPVDDNDIPF